MKRFMSILTAVLMANTLAYPVAIAEQNEKDSYLLQLSSLVNEYSEDDYFEAMNVTIGEPYLLLDGEEIPIDDSGTVAYDACKSNC